MRELKMDVAQRPQRAPVVIRAPESSAVQQQPAVDAQEVALLKQSVENTNRLRDLAEVGGICFLYGSVLMLFTGQDRQVRGHHAEARDHARGDEWGKDRVFFFWWRGVNFPPQQELDCSVQTKKLMVKTKSRTNGVQLDSA